MANRICLRAVAISVLVLTLLSCGQGQERFGNFVSSIIGGRPAEKGESLNTVAISDPQGNLFCTGTALSRRLVITAAHCLIRREPYLEKLKVYVGNGDPSRKVPIESLVSIVKAQYNPKYGGSVNSGYDVGYLITKEDLPLAEKDLLAPLTDYDEIIEALQPGHSVRLVGFGAQSRALPPPIGTKHLVDTEINAIEGVTASIGNITKGGFGGDSGGPAFVQLRNGQWRYFGITSGGGFDGPGWWGLFHDSACWVTRDSGIPVLGANFHCYEDARPVDPEETTDLSFMKECTSPRDLFRKRTVEVLGRVTGAGSDCAAIERQVLALKSLNLDNSFIVDLSPIVAFSHLEAISVAGNQRASLLPLKRLRGLKTLRVNLSLVRDKQELVQLSKGNTSLRIEILNPQAEIFLAIKNDDMTSFNFALENLTDLEFFDEGGNAPLHAVAFKGQLEMAKILLAHGANVNLVSRQYGHPPVTMAVFHGDLAMVRLFVESGADLSIKNKFGRTALEEADGRPDIAKYLKSVLENARIASP